MSQPSWRSTGLAAVLFGLPLECSRFGTEMRLIASTNREVRMPRETECRESISPSRCDFRKLDVELVDPFEGD